MKNRLNLLFILILIMVFSSGQNFLAKGQQQEKSTIKSTPPSLRLKWWKDHLALKEKSIFKNLKWRFVGPVWMSGRITDIEVPKGKPYTIYVATASGGVWKTENEGTTWEPIFENESSATIGDIAISQSNPNIIWVGTGENNSSRSNYSGTGVFKSTDGGKTWKNMGLNDSHHIGRIIIHPENPDIVYVAVLGHLYTYNEERGIYKTTDGGKTWEKILYISEKTGFIDLVMDPSNPDILYAAAWQRLRKAWNMWEYGPESGIYKTEDGGKTWKKLTKGLPTEGEMGRIGLAVAPSNPKIIYALIDNHASKRKVKPGELDPYGLPLKKVIKGAELYRSDNGGRTWKKINKQDLEDLYYTYGYYFGEVRVDPKNENVVYLLGVPLLKSTDGGKTFQRLSYKDFHGDHQAMWIDPENPNHIIDGNDGGINISYDGGKTWKDFKNLPVVQFYFVNVDMAKPFNIYGSAQDNGCFRGPVTHNPETDPYWEWERIPGGEASYIQIDPINPDIIYTEGYYGRLMRVNLRDNTTVNIRPKVKKGEPRLRCNWLTPFIISPHNPFIIYFGAQYLYRSLNRGDSWQKISPDLTTNPEQGDVPYGTITTISESPLKPGLIYVGTDDGNVWVTKNGGAKWEKITEGLPPKKWVSRIIASAFDETTVYVTLNGYRDDDFDKYIYKSIDYGKTWIDIGNNLPCGPINVIKEDPKNKKILYVGTDLGVYVSIDEGKNWHTLGSNMPTAYVHDLVVHPRDNILVAGTHGRSIWVMDVSPIQEYNEKIQAKDIHIFKIKPVKIPKEWWRPREKVVITYVLKESQPVKISILDSKGKIIKKLKGTGDKGFNQVEWDLTTESKKREERFAKPGIYIVRIETKKAKAEEKIEIKQ
ncbi:T9SS type A sorting domain-containing protein [Candidatus Aminicenantes bacterium AC-335-B20]|nr:T9SS type A sorting domain-containing protein [SCandidatus Aminicenantes bacterium Aminicenantia_JdfR_composite]MCP2596786.1 T9SS type A sorting domain-containing protein [Candidatus Aminicenantes bacterium AC-335-G13]MCP2599045.1 T9SS type A sorting domain-containing protein [Candidatus Aminicenantes bacterium AC-335-B20]MCP2605572.1 T9SS type A sorting domain-containing protein [Candidatus Aminicenantes bacterium AC-335-O07]MCP2617890.1 T9SS type A sorting domain-containing protein [Candid